MEGNNSDASSASGGFLRYGTGQQYSIRGFVSNNGEQGMSHDFFDALEPNDAYNLERITLARGPNALLGHERRILRDVRLRLQHNVENLFDWSWGDLSLRGTDWLQTPQLDRLAREGLDIR